MEALLPLLFLLPCAVMLVMMIGGHGHGARQQKEPAATDSLADLRQRRQQLDRMIEQQERWGDVRR